jgi:transcriptional regulator with XRE-family HTH domain
MRLVAYLRKLFGKRLRELRTEKGFNQLYLGTLAGVSEDFISLVERGINTPSFETIESLAAALETTVTALFTFPGEQHDRQRVRMVRSKKAAWKSSAKKTASPPASLQKSSGRKKRSKS